MCSPRVLEYVSYHYSHWISEKLFKDRCFCSFGSWLSLYKYLYNIWISWPLSKIWGNYFWHCFYNYFLSCCRVARVTCDHESSRPVRQASWPLSLLAWGWEAQARQAAVCCPWPGPPCVQLWSKMLLLLSQAHSMHLLKCKVILKIEVVHGHIYSLEELMY